MVTQSTPKGTMGDAESLQQQQTLFEVEEQEKEAEEVHQEEEKEVGLPEEEEYDSRKMPPDEELWENGPNFGQINEWKDKYGDVYVTSLTPDFHVVWRVMTRFEYRRLINNLEQAVSTGQVTQAQANLDNEESIAELCILYPPYSRQNNSKDMAGIASTISQQVMEASAFSSMEVRQL